MKFVAVGIAVTAKIVERATRNHGYCEIAERATRNGKQTSLATGACNERGTIIISEDGELDERRRRPTIPLRRAPPRTFSRPSAPVCSLPVSSYASSYAPVCCWHHLTGVHNDRLRDRAAARRGQAHQHYQPEGARPCKRRSPALAPHFPIPALTSSASRRRTRFGRGPPSRSRGTAPSTSRWLAVGSSRYGSLTTTEMRNASAFRPLRASPA